MKMRRKSRMSSRCLKSDMDDSLKCRYCDKEFKSQAWFNKHVCKNKEVFDSVEYQRILVSFDMFDFWFKYNGLKRKNHGKSFEEFFKSPYFKLFVEFSEGLQETYIADPRDYLMYLSDKRIPSKKWLNDDIRDGYKSIQHRRGSGIDRAARCLELMTMFCDQKEVALIEFFETVSVADGINWIESGRLSPWVFLNCGEADDLFSRMKSHHLDRLAKIIDIDYWNSRFAVSQEDLASIKELLNELGFSTE